MNTKQKLLDQGVIITMMPINKEQIINEMYIAYRTCASNKTIAELVEEAEAKTYTDKIRFLNSNFKNRHMAIAEFSHISFALENLPLYIAEQILRHRLLSFAKKSFRYTKIKDVDLELFKLSATYSVYCLKILQKYFYNPFPVDSPKYTRRNETNKQALIAYLEEIGDGVSPEDARGSLTPSLRTNMMIAGNLRVFTDISPKRLCKRSQGMTNLIFTYIKESILGAIPELNEDMFNPLCNICEDTCLFPSMK